MVNDQIKDDEELVPLLPPRIALYREYEKKEWRELHFTILGKKSFLELPRSKEFMSLTLATNIDGFLNTEIPGLDLFAAIASAVLSAESIIVILQRGGELVLRGDTKFAIESDSVFFGPRVDQLKKRLGI